MKRNGYIRSVINIFFRKNKPLRLIKSVGNEEFGVNAETANKKLIAILDSMDGRFVQVTYLLSVVF